MSSDWWGQPAPPSERPNRRLFDEGRLTIGEVLAGFRYLAAGRLLVAVLAGDLAAMVFGMPVALFPELAQHTFGGPADGGLELGLLYAAYPAGVFVAGPLSATFTRARRHGALMAAAATAWGVTVVLGLALRIALAALVLGGAVNFVLSVPKRHLTGTHRRRDAPGSREHSSSCSTGDRRSRTSYTEPPHRSSAPEW